MALWELPCEVLEVVVRPLRLAQLGDDAESERVAADTGEVLAEKVEGSLAVAGRGAYDLVVVAFPVHLSVTWTFSRGPRDGVEVGEGELEGRVGFDSEVERRGGLVAVDRSLCLAVPRRGFRTRGDGAAVVLNRWPGGIEVTIRAEGLTLSWLHIGQVAWAP